MTWIQMAGATLLVALVGGPVFAEDVPAAASKPACCQAEAAAGGAAAALETKLAAMNAAQGAAKIDAMADVLNELVAQHKSAHQREGCCGGGGGRGMMQDHSGHGGRAP